MTAVRHWPRAMLPGMALAVLGLAACLAAAADVAELADIPHPDPATLKSDVQASLVEAREVFEQQRVAPIGPELAAAYGKLGLHYQAHEQQAAAQACYRNAAALDPTDFRWPYYLAVHYEETGEFAAALTQYRHTLDLNGNYPAGATRLGLLLVEAGDYDDAERILRFVIEQQPKNAAALAGLGAVAYERRDYASATDFYIRALAIQPKASQLHYRLGLAYRQLGDVASARRHLELQGDRIPSILDPLLLLMQGYRFPSAYYLNLGSDAFARGDLVRAAKLYEFATRINPGNVQALLLLGRAFGAQDQNDRALEQFQRVLAIDPGHVEANFYAGAISESGSNDADAIRYFRAALDGDSDMVTARLALANALMRTQQYAEAGRNYGGLAGETNADVNYRAGMAWLAAGDCGGADQALTRAYQADQLAGRVIQAMARLYSTCKEFDADRRRSALQFAQLLYDGQPGLETAATLAMAFAANDQFDEAEAYQLQAIFESSKRGDAAAQAVLQADLDRYRRGMRAERAWPPGHAVFQPPRRQ